MNENLKKDLVKLQKLLHKISKESENIQLSNCPLSLKELIEPNLSLKDININKLNDIIKIL